MANERIKQSYDNSCGAACLTCAAKELGIDDFPDVRPWNGEQFIVSPHCERLLYQYTGTGDPGVDIKNRGYSMPAKLATIGRELGLKNPTIYMQENFYGTALTVWYKSALAEARGAGIPVVLGPMPALADYQRALKVMAVMKVCGLHYVMQRPDGSFMDPGDGQNFDSFEAMNSSWLKCYADTGIALVFDSEWVWLEPLF